MNKFMQAVSDLEQKNVFYRDSIVAILEKVFSALATDHPDYALEILKQLNEQESAIRELSEERAAQ